MLNVLFLDSDGIQRLSDFDSGTLLHGFTEGSSHTGLKSIGSGTGQHFVDSDNVPRVNTASHVEGVLTCLLGHVFIGGNTGCFQRVWRNLFLFPRNHVNRAWELVAQSFFTANIVSSDFRLGDTSAVTRLGIWFVLGVTIASCWSSTHLRFNKLYKIFSNPN